MKCPKCGYLGFEPVDRCRNCGYDFSLSAPVDLPELALRRDTQTLRPLEDLALLDDASSARETRVSAPAPSAGVPPPTRGELPLFGGFAGDDAPLITRASPPRPPLAVRRATPEIPRLRREQPRMATLDLELDERDPSASPTLRTRPHPVERPRDIETSDAAPDAGLGARLLAALIDLAILLAVDAIVLYFTTQICGLTIWELGQLPKGPLVVFLLVQNVGYLVIFTAGGQTLGKMAAGIKVISSGSGSALDVGHALVRTLVWLVLAVPAGLGFLPAIFSSDHRGLHDRFAGTRVVRASA